MKDLEKREGLEQEVIAKMNGILSEQDLVEEKFGGIEGRVVWQESFLYLAYIIRAPRGGSSYYLSKATGLKGDYLLTELEFSGNELTGIGSIVALDEKGAEGIKVCANESTKSIRFQTMPWGYFEKGLEDGERVRALETISGQLDCLVVEQD